MKWLKKLWNKKLLLPLGLLLFVVGFLIESRKVELVSLIVLALSISSLYRNGKR